ncbi:MAG: PAS domain S-box protein, partial [Rhizobacter sp.]|nr:PAS domain S-box protein [Rhizobacter sp.]
MAAGGRVPEPGELYDHAACGLLLTEADGTIRVVNDTFCRWTGFARDELVDRRKLQELLTVGARIFHQTHWSPLLQIQGSVAEVKLDVVDAG